ncbi:hypothetical protein V8E54_008811 [Elaphomyces granulatus]
MSLPHEDLAAVCASVPADGPADEILASVPSLAKDPNVEAEKKRALQYTNDSKKPNVHIGLHYELVKHKYGLLSHIHVLIGEEKHRWFKKIVYHTSSALSLIAKIMPSLFQTMLPRSEIEDYVAEDDEESQLALTDDGGHICPAAISCIQAKHALNLPVRTSAMSDAFRKQLRAVFQNSYDMVIVIEFGKVAVKETCIY